MKVEPAGSLLGHIAVPGNEVNFRLGLPDGWNDYPEGDESKGIGDGWARSMVSLGMSVPSATMPNATKIEEQNVLINPMHSQFKQIKFIEQHDFDFDSRIKKLLE